MGVEWCEEANLDWCISIPGFISDAQIFGDEFTPPSTTFSTSIGFMGFSPGNEFISKILNKFETDYDPNRWGCGTVLASFAYLEYQKVVGKNTDDERITLVKPSTFYPIGYQDILKYMKEDDQALWAKMTSVSYALHIFGKVSGNAEVQPGSLVDRALSTFTLSPP